MTSISYQAFTALAGPHRPANRSHVHRRAGLLRLLLLLWLLVPNGRSVGTDAFSWHNRPIPRLRLHRPRHLRHLLLATAHTATLTAALPAAHSALAATSTATASMVSPAAPGRTYSQAEAPCNERGGTLAQIASAAANGAIVAAMPAGTIAWIGGQETEGGIMAVDKRRHVQLQQLGDGGEPERHRGCNASRSTRRSWQVARARLLG